MPKDFEFKYGFHTYIRKVLLVGLEYEYHINAHALNSVNLMLHDAANQIISSVKVANKNKSTITSRSIETGVTLTLTKGLANAALNAGKQALTNYNNSNPGTKQSPSSRTVRAGLTFSVSVVENIIRVRGCKARVQDKAAVYLAAVLEFLCREIFALTSLVTRENYARRITPRHLMIGVNGDMELRALFNGVINGGVIPTV